MNLRTLVWKELWERPTALATSLLAILLGVTALVALRHVTVFSEREVSAQLNSLGANILVLPQGASMADYYAADASGLTLPEEHVSEIMLAGLTGVEKLSPKLCIAAQLGGQPITLTGILPQSEFQTKNAWQTVSLFTAPKHVGCKKANCAPRPESLLPEALATERAIENLGLDDAVVGSEVAAATGLKKGEQIELLGAKFNVLAVLPTTGTVDDSRVFAHLHKVQVLSSAGQVVSAIEILGCCDVAAGQLVPELEKLLPTAKIVTISQVVQTQVGVNRLMSRASLLVLVVLVLVGGASVLGTIASNVRERRKEIGTLIALGAAPALVAQLFLLKALVLGVLGGVSGAVLGTLLAIWLGPEWAGVEVAPLWPLGVAAGLGALAVTLLAAYWPARQAALLDPCTCFQET